MAASLEHRLFGVETVTTVGRYELGPRIGSGAMGSVFRAHDPKLSRDVALKVIGAAAVRLDREEYVQRLVREAKVLAKLSHPNVVSVYDVGAAEDQVFIAMELIEGVTLREWMSQRLDLPARRRIAEGLGLFVEAGRGLAAAHALGLVHRDFKPDNVLVGTDGRVRVVDFGLAHGAGKVSTDATEHSFEDAGTATTVMLTATGQLVGTPMYMAPEQFDGSRVDAVADQWAFCVSLYELCYAARPFDGSSLPSLAAAICDGVDSIPDRPGVSGTMRRVLARGLRRDPTARYPGLEQLLAELERELAAPRRRLVASLISVAAIGGAAAAWAVSPDGSVDCARAGDPVREVWNDAAKTELRTAIESSSRPYAPRSAEVLVAGLDDFATRWSRARVAACEAVHERGEHSPEMLDRQASCFDQGLREVRARIAIWSAGADVIVDRAADLAAGLPGTADCASVEVLGARPPLPDDPRERTLFADVEEATAQADALLQAAKLDDSLAVLEPLRSAVEASAHAPTRARWWSARAQVALTRGDTETFAPAARKALWDAVRSGDVRTAARLASQLAHTDQVAERFDTASDWANLALGFAERADDGQIEAQAHMILAACLSRAGKPEQAEAAYEKALELARRDDRDWLVRLIQSDRGAALAARGELAEAEATYRAAMDQAAEALGEDHPDFAHEQVNLAAILFMEGRTEEAEPMLRDGIARWKRVFGPTYPKLVQMLSNLSAMQQRLGRLEQSKQTIEEAIAVARTHDGPESPQVLRARLQRLLLVSSLGEPGVRSEAQDLARSLRKSLVNSPVELGASLEAVIGVLLDQEDYEQALAVADEVAALYSGVDPGPERAWSLAALRTSLALDSNDVEAALRDGRTAVEIAGSSEIDPAKLHHSQLDYARALARSDREDEAVDLLTESIAGMEKHGEMGNGDLDDARELLARHQN